MEFKSSKIEIRELIQRLQRGLGRGKFQQSVQSASVVLLLGIRQTPNQN